jgi:hypothetical protein
MRIKLPTLGAIIITVAANVPQSLAHHGWSANTGDVAVSGELATGLSLAGPHATLQVRDADGQIWDVTLAPAPRTHRAGLREDTIPVGAQITVEGERNADPTRFELKGRRVIYDDRQFDVYPPQPQ